MALSLIHLPLLGGTTDNISRAILGVTMDVDIADCDDASILKHTQLLIMVNVYCRTMEGQ